MGEQGQWPECIQGAVTSAVAISSMTVKCSSCNESSLVDVAVLPGSRCVFVELGQQVACKPPRFVDLPRTIELDGSSYVLYPSVSAMFLSQSLNLLQAIGFGGLHYSET